MLYNVTLYYILLTGEVYKMSGHETFSAEPIVECVVKQEILEKPWERYISKVCMTERIYYHMTGVDTIEVLVEGIYET